MTANQGNKDYSLTRVREYSLNGKSAVFVVETEKSDVQVSISFYGADVIRYSLVSSQGGRDKLDLVRPEFLSSKVEPTLHRRADSVVLSSNGIDVGIHLQPWKVEVNCRQRSIVSELSSDLNAHQEAISLPTGYAEKNGQPYSSRINISLDPYETLFGLGEKFTALNKRGQEIVCWNLNAYGAGCEYAYKNIPLLLSTRGYGFFLNETCRSTWNIGRDSNSALSIDLESPDFDLFILLGHSLKDILKKYSDLAGHAGLPPRWSFGLWVSPLGEQLLGKNRMNQDGLLSLADSIRRRDIPCDVIHLDAYWMGGQKLCHFNWDPGEFPNPKEMISLLKDRGFRLCLWEHPFIEKGSDLYNEGSKKGFLLKREDGSVYDNALVYVSPEKRKAYAESFYAQGGVVDFSNPDAVEWYKDKHRPLLGMGVAAFKTDFGEMIPYDACFSNGKTGREMHNVYPLLYNKAVFEVVREHHDRPVVWGRSGYAGSQLYPIQWSGDPLADFKSLSATIRGGLSYGLSGVPFWTFDLGGFKGEPSLKAYVRWVQTGLLLSHSRLHGTTPRLPWYFGDEALKIVREYTHLRYRLIPYIYGMALEAVREGTPVMRALGLEFENDRASLATDTEYMLGPYILIAPVLNEDGEVDLYLPPANWYNHWTGERIAGPVSRREKFSLETLPIYIRDTAIIPTCDDRVTVSEIWDPIYLNIYPAAHGAVEIPEEGNSTNTRVMISKKENSGTVHGFGPERTWKIFFYDSNRPAGIKIESSAVTEWRYNQTNRTLEVEIGQCNEWQIVLILSR